MRSEVSPIFVAGEVSPIFVADEASPTHQWRAKHEA